MKSDILLSDPVENEKGNSDSVFIENTVRGCSYFYGKDAANKFLNKNKLISIIRGHEAQIDGFKMHKWNGEEEFPPVITIFSAANYCETYHNKGAIIKFVVNLIRTIR